MDVRPLIERLGGPSLVARETGESVKTVSMWGTRNRLPARHIVAVWRLAQARGIDWTPPGAEGLALAPREAA